MIALLLRDSTINTLIIHPQDRHRPGYIADLLGEDYSFTYVQFTGEQLDFEVAQDEVFRNFDTIGSTTTIPSALVIDECDRLSPEALENLLPYLIELIEHNPELMILLYARELPPILFNTEVFSGTTCVIQNTQLTQPHSTYPVVDVSGFGVGQVRVNGNPVDFGESKLSHEMFFYILENPVISRDTLIETIWSDTDKKSAVTVFHTVRNNLNTLLGFEFLKRMDSHYELTSEIVLHYDVYEYRSLLNDVTYNQSIYLVENYQTALELQRHPFMINARSAWVKDIRHALRMSQSDICMELAKHATSNDVALGLYSRSFRLNPYREDSAGAMMQIYLNENTPCEALYVYEVLAENLDTEYGIKPGSEIQKLKQIAEANCL